MNASLFDSDASVGQRRAVIRRNAGDVEMIELPWGLEPHERGGRPFTVIRAESRQFVDHRCLVPASEFRHRSRGRQYGFSLADGDWFYFAGIWQPSTAGWPEAFAVLTIVANSDVAPYHDRQMAVVRRDDRMAWLNRTCGEEELLRPLPAGTFKVRFWDQPKQPEFAF